ncbi:MAG: aminotransferase class I/II-fold pyridoxal phosphate-dependent enzyme [Rhizobiales bacterium]|nr:aminotransferase class I/II-fold pyridoxal phosphate-dependent enzyme [Hyphomicrobiales bacterium]
MIDLRSDTTSRPTAAMREAIARAEVGDDVFSDDPTVNRLEAETARLVGKEAALFVPSGTMANQIALRLHLRPGQFVAAETGSHVLRVEAGATAGVSGVAAIAIAGEAGKFTPEQLESALPIRHPEMRLLDHYRPGLVWMENTHNAGGGTVWRPDTTAAVAEVARREGCRLHLDGARLWNAAVALGLTEAELAAPFDTVSVCFSKGLGAPVGSAIAGSRDLIARARGIRSQFGGGMRQAGILAAAALHALENHRARLAEDHANALAFARGIADAPGIKVEPAGVETNIVRIDLETIDAGTFVDALAAEGVRMLPLGRRLARAVTCLDVSRNEAEEAADITRRVAERLAR